MGGNINMALVEYVYIYLTICVCFAIYDSIS